MFNLPDGLSDLIQYDASTLAVTSRESKHREFKLAFVTSDFSIYTRTLAAFGNASGGYILFGVSDKPRQITGVNEIIDEARWADRIREEFDPEIPIATRTYKVGTLHVFAIGVDQVANRPIVCRRSRSMLDKRGRDVEAIREGAIYYRYAGQTRLIGYPELMAMLADREARRIKSFMDTINVIQKVGVEQAGVLKMSEGSSNIFMTPETAKGLSLIDKGRIVEEDGSPAYVVMGNVDIQKVIHAPLDEADKNLPTEVATQLKPIIHKTYDAEASISPSQVSKIMKHLGLHDDNIHCIYEKKFQRKFITRKGMTAVTDFIKEKPFEALKAFGSKASIARYEGRMKKAEDKTG